MTEFYLAYQSELLWTLITLISIILLQFIARKTIKRVGRVSNFMVARTLLISKYVSTLLVILAIGALLFIWNINFKDLGLLFSSVFAVIGVALFAQWSILSNLTAGVVLFFYFPFKIGDEVKILDNEIKEDNEANNIFFIEDISAFHLHLRRKNGELLTYPNNMMLQKAVSLVRSANQSNTQIGS